MSKKNLLKLSLITAIIGVVVLFLAYFCFHFVTDEGITFVWHAEAGKPFVTILIGIFGVLFMWTSTISLILALICFKDKK
jgi:multisubunit Na+/H+ antiporter MnhB subunit